VEFSVEEMSRRLETVRTRMDAVGIDCMLITGVENCSYFVGVPVGGLFQTRRPWCVLIPVRSEPVVVMRGPSATARTVQLNGFVKRVEGYAFPVASGLPNKLAELLEELGARRVACELGLEMRLGIPPADFQTLVGLLPGVEFVDGSSIIWSLRMFKSPEEVARLRKACEITSTTRQRVFQQVQPGMTEGDVAELWADLMHQAGGSGPFFMFINSGPVPDLLASPTKRIERGETLWLDGGVYYKGYTCDFSRVASVGPPSPRQRRLHQDTVDVLDLVFEQIRPGVPVADIARLAATELQRRGYKSQDTAGHSMGMLINEPPMLTTWNDMVLREGLVAGIEFGPAEAEGFFVLEQLIQVTRDGYDLLTPESTDMVLIDW